MKITVELNDETVAFLTAIRNSDFAPEVRKRLGRAPSLQEQLQHRIDTLLFSCQTKAEQRNRHGFRIRRDRRRRLYMEHISNMTSMLCKTCGRITLHYFMRMLGLYECDECGTERKG